MSEHAPFPILQSSPRSTAQQLLRDGQYFVVIGVPWELVKAHEKQFVENYSRSIDEVAARGGLAVDEMLAVLEDRPFRMMPARYGFGPDPSAHVRLAEVIWHYVTHRAH